MSNSDKTSESDRERRRGGLYFFLFFLLVLLIGGLYWAWITFGNQDKPVIDPVQPPETVVPATVDTTAITPDDKPLVDPVIPETPPVEITPEPTPPVEVTPTPPEYDGPPRVFIDARWRQTATLTGTDTSGNSATFTVHLLRGANSWTFGKSATLDMNGQTLPTAELFAGASLGEDYCNQSVVIALGAASYEGEEALNYRLASARGQNLVAALSAVKPACTDNSGPRHLIINLGEHHTNLTCTDSAESCHAVSAPQRPVVIVSGQSDDRNTNYGMAFKSAVEQYEASGRQLFPNFRLSDYSQFEISY